MKRQTFRWVSGAIIIALLAIGWLLITTRSQAIGMITQSVDQRPPVDIFPSAFGLDYEEVLVASAPGPNTKAALRPMTSTRHNGSGGSARARSS